MTEEDMRRIVVEEVRTLVFAGALITVSLTGLIVMLLLAVSK